MKLSNSLQSKRTLKIVITLIAVGLITTVISLFPVFNRYDEINTDNMLATENNSSILDILSPPNSMDRFVSIVIKKDSEGIINLEFNNKIIIDGLSFYFVGDLSGQPSMGAKNISIFSEDSSGQMILVNSTMGNSRPYYKLLTKDKIKTSKIELRFSEPYYYDVNGEGDVRINDLHFYKKNKTNLIKSFNSAVNLCPQSVLAYPFYYLVFLITLLIPGFVAFYLISKKYNLNLDNELILVFSPIFGIVIMFISVIIFLISDLRATLYAYPMISVLLLFEFFRRKLYNDFCENRTMIYLMTCALFLVAMVVMQRDYFFNLQYLGSYLDTNNPIPIDGYPGYFVDSLFPWRISRVYLHDYALNDPMATKLLTETTIYDRTPVLPMISVVILNAFGEGHFIYQRFLEVIAIFFLGAYYVLVSRYYTVKIAVISSILVLLNVQIFLIAQNVEIYYKYFSIYPAILALTIFLFGKKYKNIIVGLLLSLAFLIHPSTLIYSVLLIILYVVKYKISKAMLSNIYSLITILFLTIAIWLLIPLFVLNSSTSTNNHSFYISEFGKINANIILTKIYNIISLFIPSVLRISQGTRETLSIRYFISYQFLRFSIISNLTPLFFILLPYYFILNFRKAKQWILIATLPLFIYWFFYLNQSDFFFMYGGAYFILYPFVIPLCLAFIVNYMLKERIVFRIIILLSYLCSVSISLFYLSGIFEKLKNPQIIISVLFWLILTACCLLAIMVFVKTLIYDSPKNDLAD